MAFRVRVDQRTGIVLVEWSGFVEFGERLQLLDEKLFYLQHFDIRNVIVDRSGMSPDNVPLDDLYFAEVLCRHREKFRSVRSLLIHPNFDQANQDAVELMASQGFNHSHRKVPVIAPPIPPLPPYFPE